MWCAAQAVEDLLRRLNVQWLVLPSINSVLPMWTGKFHFIPLTIEEHQALQSHIVSPDFDSAQLVKKPLFGKAATRPALRSVRSSNSVTSGGSKASNKAKLQHSKDSNRKSGTRAKGKENSTVSSSHGRASSRKAKIKAEKRLAAAGDNTSSDDGNEGGSFIVQVRVCYMSHCLLTYKLASYFCRMQEIAALVVWQKSANGLAIHDCLLCNANNNTVK